MTKSCLQANQRQVMEIIERCPFGIVERLQVRNGLPFFEPEPRIVQMIKLEVGSYKYVDSNNAELTLKLEFQNLFEALRRLGQGVVDIEIRHNLPFRLLIARRFRELLGNE